MADRLEDRIRDFLTVHLDMLEEGLKLIDKEYVLDNPFGSGGKIDILARDRFGHIVVIEIKRSNQTARQALNEIHKYTALFRIQQGLDQTQLRLLIVSTEWHELLLPFSECVDTFPYSVMGLHINAVSTGEVTNVARITPISKAGLLRMSKIQGVYLYKEAATRDASIDYLVAVAKQSCLADYFIIRIDHNTNDPRVCYPYGLYLVFASPLTSMSSDQIDKIKRIIEWEDNLDEPDENFLAAVNSRFAACESSEIGYPEKLTNIRSSWSTKIVVREGRLAQENSLVSDDDLLRQAQFVEGGSPIYLAKIASPRFVAEWNRVRNDLDKVFLGISEWEKVVPLFLDEVEHSMPDGTISLGIYNPANLLMSLYSVVKKRDFSHCPRLEIVAESSTQRTVKILFSTLMWNGITVDRNPKEIIEQVYGSVEEWMIDIQMHSTFEKEVEAMNIHGLSAPIIEFDRTDESETGPQLLVSENGILEHFPFEPDRHLSIADFATANLEYLNFLRDYIETKILGLSL